MVLVLFEPYDRFILLPFKLRDVVFCCVLSVPELLECNLKQLLCQWIGVPGEVNVLRIYVGLLHILRDLLGACYKLHMEI